MMNAKFAGVVAVAAACYDGSYCWKDEHPAMGVGQGNSPDECCDICNGLPQCAGWVWKDNKCHLKENPDYVKTGCPPTDANCFQCGLSSGIELEADASCLFLGDGCLQEGKPKCCDGYCDGQPGVCVPWFQGNASVEQPLEVKSEAAGCSVDYCWKDEHPAMGHGGYPTIEACCDACNGLPQCAGWVWKDNKCHLKANPDYVKTGCPPTDANCFQCGLSNGVAEPRKATPKVEQPLGVTSEAAGCSVDSCWKDEHPAMAVPGYPTVEACCDACNGLADCAGWVWKDNKCHLKANPDYVKTGCPLDGSANCFQCGLSNGAVMV